MNNNPINYKDPSGHYECKANLNCGWLPPTEDYLFHRAFEHTTWLYENKFSLPFGNNPPVVRGVGPGHDGVDWDGEINVIAPYQGTVEKAGPDAPAGMWRLEHKVTREIREWSVFSTATEGENSKLRRKPGNTELLEPEKLLATGEWRDVAPGWSHVQGTAIHIKHTPYLTTRYYHTNPSVTKDSFVSKGDPLGVTANTGWSRATHLHQTVVFTYKGQKTILDPLTVSTE